MKTLFTSIIILITTIANSNLSLAASDRNEKDQAETSSYSIDNHEAKSGQIAATENSSTTSKAKQATVNAQDWIDSFSRVGVSENQGLKRNGSKFIYIPNQNFKRNTSSGFGITFSL